MREILLVARREIAQRGRSKAYLVSTGLVSLLLAAAVAVPALLSDDEDEPAALVLAVAGELGAAREQALAAAFGPALEVVGVADAEAVQAEVSAGAADAGLAADRVYAPEASVFSSSGAFAARLAELLARVDALDRAGLTGPDLLGSLAPEPLEVVRTGDTDQREQDGRAVVAWVAITFLYGTFIMYGQWMTNGVIEEKSSRVVEVLLGVLRPRQLLAGKLLGLGVLGVIQIVAFLAPAAAIGLALDSQLVPAGVGGLVAVVALWWVLGYAFYSTVMGSMGATASRPEDAQAVGAPATILLVLAFFVSFSALQDPTGTMAVVTSFVPFTAPLVMVVRIAVGQVSTWEVLLSIGILVVSIQLLVVVAGRIYENGLLKTGSRLKLRDAWRSTT